jgi:hypothetical protein
MGVSENRMDELIYDMLKNADEDGWCYVPDGLTDEEQDELSRRLAIITMQDRIDTLLEGILSVMKHMEDVKTYVSEYDVMDRIKIKSGLSVIKEDSQGLLMDLHSDDIIKDFFMVEMIDGDRPEDKLEAFKAKDSLQELADTEFKDQLSKIKKYCSTMIDIADDIVVRLDNEQ